MTARRRWMDVRLALCVGAVLCAGAAVRAELPAESLGGVETLTMPAEPHWIWVTDALLERTALVDLDSGRTLGMVDGGWGITAAVHAPGGRAFYVPETHYSRGSRGDRTDVVTFYDLETLAPQGEVELPPRRAINVLPTANATLSDDGRFLAVFNMTPATSLSIVDVRERRFAGEIETPGCSLVYAAGARRFGMLCADGAWLTVALDDAGGLESKTRSEPFFDPMQDPITEKAVRMGDRWLFASFEGVLHEVDVSGETPRFPEPWSLVSEADRRDSWRVGGRQHLAVHVGHGRLYSLMHQGGPDTHKQGGRELWIYDLAKRKRLGRIALRSPGLTYLGVPVEFGQDWIEPFNRLYDTILSSIPEIAAASSVVVTQDEKPLIVAGSEFSGSVVVYDGGSGEFLRRVTTGNVTALVLQAPYAGAAP